MMKNILFWIFAVMVLIDLGWVAVPMQAAEPEQFPAFSEIDKDKDGYITADESMAVPGLMEQLTSLDRNADGKIDKAEYASTTNAASRSGDTIPRTQMK